MPAVARAIILSVAVSAAATSPPGLGAQTPRAASGVIPRALVGVWKGVDVPAESRDAWTGAGIALIGWSLQITLQEDGHYEWEEYREGELAACRIAILQRASGTARAEGYLLTLEPAAAFETKRDACSRTASYADRPIPQQPGRYTVSLAWTELLSGFETLALTLSALEPATESYTLHLVTDPGQEWPAAVLPTTSRGDRAPPALPDLWSWPPSVAPTFFDPVTGTFTRPDDDAHWLRLSPDGRYEWAGWKAGLVPGPGCDLAALTYERGRYRLTVGEYDWQNTLTTTPDTAITIEHRSGCGSEDGTKSRPVPLHPSLYYWGLGRTVDNEEVLELKCSGDPRERNRWQFLLCHWGFEFRTLMTRMGERR